MPQFFAHMPWKGRSKTGRVKTSEVHQRTTHLQITSSELQDLLADFACERAGLPRKMIERISLDRDVYASDSLDVTLNVTFRQDLSEEK